MSPKFLRHLLAFTFAALPLAAQQIHLNVVYVCNGERIFINGCNIRDTSDAGRCYIEHPDKARPGGISPITNMTRAELKQLLPTCQQPSPQAVAAAEAREKRAIDTQNAIQAKNEEMMRQPAYTPGAGGVPAPSKDPETRAMNRCISAGRLPASCTGNALLGGFTKMIGSILGGADSNKPKSGPTMAGVFQGAGNWRIDFIDDGVLVNCAGLSPNQETYKVEFRGGHALVVINTRPRPLVLTYRADNTMTAPGPFTIDGVVAGGYTAGTSTPGHTESHTTTSTQRINAYEAPNYSAGQLTNTGGGTYDATTTTTSNTYVPGTSTPGYTNFIPRRATCPALNLSTKGAGVGIQTMQTDLLKSMLGGDKGPPTPPGIRMQGIYAAATGFSVQFFPESVILGCGPDSARAYPYTVTAGANGALIHVEAPDHPLNLTLTADNSLTPDATGPYQVHGRVVIGQGANDNLAFAPFERTCDLAALTPSASIPSAGGNTAAPTRVASTAASGSPAPASLSPGNDPSKASGNAVLSLASGLDGTPNPLANHPYILLRQSVRDIVLGLGIDIPAGSNPFKVLGIACSNRAPDCQRIQDAVKASAASVARADATGAAMLPGLPPGTYHLMISTRYNNQPIAWTQPVQLHAGANTFTLSPANATPIQ